MAKAVTATTEYATVVVLFQPLGDFEAGKSRKLDVHENQMRLMLARQR